MGFESYNPASAEPPINGTFGQLLGSTLGAQQDEEVEALRTAVLSRVPERCPDDALDFVGRHFNIERYAGEPHDSYRARLTEAFAAWAKAGSPESIEDQISAFSITGCDVRVYEDFEGHWFQGDIYSRFLVVIGPSFGALGFEPLTAPFTTPATGGSTATIQQVRAIKRIVLKWKSAHGYPVFIVLRFGDVVLGNVNSKAPFTPPIDGVRCVWDIGKLIVDNIGTGPFVAGGYEV